MSPDSVQANNQEKGKENSVDSQAMNTFITSMGANLLSLNIHEIVSLDTMNKARNGMDIPKIDISTIKLHEGEYAVNNGMCLIGGKGDDFYLGYDVNPGELQKAGLKKVESYVPFSNGVHKDVSLIAGFVGKQAERAQAMEKARDAKYSV